MGFNWKASPANMILLLCASLLSTIQASPITPNEVALRKIAVSQAKPELLSAAVKYANPDLLRVALTDAKPSHLKAALTASNPARASATREGWPAAPRRSARRQTTAASTGWAWQGRRERPGLWRGRGGATSASATVATSSVSLSRILSQRR